MPHFSHISCAPRNWEISCLPYRSPQPSPNGNGQALLQQRRDRRAHRHHGSCSRRRPRRPGPGCRTARPGRRSGPPAATSRTAGRWSRRAPISGSPADSHAVRAMSIACGPACETQPMITSSTAAGSTPVRSISSVSTCAARSAGWTDGQAAVALADRASAPPRRCMPPTPLPPLPPRSATRTLFRLPRLPCGGRGKRHSSLQSRCRRIQRDASQRRGNPVMLRTVGGGDCRAAT